MAEYSVDSLRRLIIKFAQSLPDWYYDDLDFQNKGCDEFTEDFFKWLEAKERANQQAVVDKAKQYLQQLRERQVNDGR